MRYYEGIGLIPSPARVGQHRRYDDDILDLLTVVRAAREVGFGLAEVRVLLDAIGRDGPGPAWSTLAAGKQVELESWLRRVEAMMGLLASISRCECDTLAECALRLSKADTEDYRAGHDESFNVRGSSNESPDKRVTG